VTASTQQDAATGPSRPDEADGSGRAPARGPSWRAAAGIFALALGTRLFYLFAVARDYVPRSDARQYVEMAKAIAAGHGLAINFPFAFRHATAFRPPLYPYLLGAVFSVTPSIGLGQVVNVVLGAATAVVVARIGTILRDVPTGILAGVAVALYPPLVAGDATVLSESLSLLLLSLLLLALFRHRVSWAAVALGLLLLTRPSAQAIAVALVVFVLYRFGWRRALNFALITAAVVTPWLARNALLLGEPQLVTSNGFNLAAQYSPTALAEDRFVDPFFEDGRDLAKVRDNNYTEIGLDDALSTEALRSIRNHLGEVPSVWVRNAEMWFELDPGRNDVPDQLDGRSTTARRWTLPLTFAVFVIGIYGLLLARSDWRVQVLLLLAAVLTIMSVLTVATPRLREPFDLVCLLGCALAVRRWTARGAAVPTERTDWRGDRHRAVSLVPGLVAGTVIVATVATALVLRPRVEDTARDRVREALARDCGAVTSIADGYPVDTDAPGGPPAGPREALRSAQRLQVVLWQNLPRLDRQDGLRSATTELTRAVQTHSVFATISVAEQLKATDAAPFSWEAVKTAYRRVRSENPVLPPWPRAVAGIDVRRASRRLADLGTALHAGTACRSPGAR
jgi:hypothetical protein